MRARGRAGRGRCSERGGTSRTQTLAVRALRPLAGRPSSGSPPPAPAPAMAVQACWALRLGWGFGFQVGARAIARAGRHPRAGRTAAVLHVRLRDTDSRLRFIAEPWPAGGGLGPAGLQGDGGRAHRRHVASRAFR